jgi:hypothetical protein
MKGATKNWVLVLFRLSISTEPAEPQLYLSCPHETYLAGCLYVR